ncbi:AZG1 [Symbiodinium sp. CCMP2456]|nr:AZG1 [Symbiodinium sp. CCMP2456]
MIVILLSAILSWILNAAAVEQFTYKPMCCLGSVSYTEPAAGGVEWYPKPGGGYYPKPTCENPYTVPGKGKMEETDSGVSFMWDSTASVALSNGVYTITNAGSSVNHTGSRDSSFNGGCTDTCHAMMGGFNPACFGTVLVETGCWTAMSYQSRATQSLVLDEFGEGCIGGAGRIPKTFSAPSAIASVPLIDMAGDLVAPFDGWYGCDANGQNCVAGDVSGGTILAWDTSGFSDWQGFWNPLLTLLYIDFIGTMGFLYAAADLSGLVDPKKPETFPGCYAAFMADAVGTFVGGFLGTSSVTTYGESMAGVYEGGRTGLTALGVKDIDWTDYMQAIPSTICILLQITTYKIEVGVLGALMVWAFLMIFSGRIFLYNDKVWNSMPGWFQNFVANQNGDEEFRNRLREVGKLPPAEDKMEEGRNVGEISV